MWHNKGIIVSEDGIVLIIVNRLFIMTKADREIKYSIWNGKDTVEI